MRRFRRFGAVVCLMAWSTGCGEQAISLAGIEPVPEYEVVRFGPKLVLRDALGNEIPVELNGQSLVDGSDPMLTYRSLPVEDRRVIRQIVTMFLQSSGPAGDTIDVPFRGEALRVEVHARTASGTVQDYSITGGAVMLRSAVNNMQDTAITTIALEGELLASLTATIAQPGEGSFLVGQKTARNLAILAHDTREPTLSSQVRDSWANQQATELPPPDDWDDEEAWLDWCGLRAVGIVSAVVGAVTLVLAAGWGAFSAGVIAEFVAALRTLSTAATLAAISAACLALYGLIQSFFSFTDLWSESCQQKYGSVWDYIANSAQSAMESVLNGIVTILGELADEGEEWLCAHFAICP